MKPFFSSVAIEDSPASSTTSHIQQGSLDRAASRSARIAVYDSSLSAPRVVLVEANDPASFIEDVSSKTYSITRDLGGSAPYTAIREVVENLIHADFREPVVSILDDGRTLRFADQGPGIVNKDKARLPGFTTATGEMKSYIRGVGSGLPIVVEYLCHTGGNLRIEDNLGCGTVVTLSFHDDGSSRGAAAPTRSGRPNTSVVTRELTKRQTQVLSLVMEAGEAGPTLVSKELGVGLSTAHRDLDSLEKAGLILVDESGKRVLSESGHAYLDELLRRG